MKGAKLQARKDLPSPYKYGDRFWRWNEALRWAALTRRHPVKCPGDAADG
jgi:hypothetical protein